MSFRTDVEMVSSTFASVFIQEKLTTVLTQSKTEAEARLEICNRSIGNIYGQRKTSFSLGFIEETQPAAALRHDEYHHGLHLARKIS